jgi:hypothetical protein
VLRDIRASRSQVLVGMDNLDSDIKRALRTALLSVEAAQGDASSELAFEHLAGAVHRLTFVVAQLIEELAGIKRRED